MHEDLAAVVAGEESIPLVGVVPLDLAGRHAQTSRIPERTDNQRSGDRQDAMGASKAIGPGRPIAATLWPAPVPRGASGPRGGRPHTVGGAGTGWRVRPESPRYKIALALYPAVMPRNPTQNGPGPRPRAVLADFGRLGNQKSMSGPPPGPAGAGVFSGFSAMTASVVRNRPAIEAAFCSAERVTFAGSMMPALNMSTYSPVAAFRPWPADRVLTFSTTTPPSRPAFTAICFSGSSSARHADRAPVASSPTRSSFSKALRPACSSANA